MKVNNFFIVVETTIETNKEEYLSYYSNNFHSTDKNCECALKFDALEEAILVSNLLNFKNNGKRVFRPVQVFEKTSIEVKEVPSDLLNSESEVEE